MPQLRPTLGVQQLHAELLSGLHALFGPLEPETALAIARRAEWLALASGEVLFRQGEPGGSLYLVISGRLQVVHRDAGGGERVLGEVARGESVGEMAFFTGEARSATLAALRDSVLLRFSRDVFDDIVARHPQVTTSIVRLLIERMRRSMRPQTPGAAVANVAVVPTRPEFAAPELAIRLAAAMSAYGSTLHLTSGRVDDAVGAAGAAQATEQDEGGARLAAWLDAQEGEYQFVVYEADPGDTPWTRRCIRQADRILLVGAAGGDPAPGEVEEHVLLGRDDGRATTTANRTLVLVHRGGARLPSGTARWLAARPVRDHQHLRWDVPADFERLARLVAGRSVGVVLGGGGARGFAHIGVIRALREAGVPIDLVGGTSMGGAIAAQCALGWDYDTMLEANARVWLELKPHYKVTVPVIAIVDNRKAMRCAELLYGDADVEDCWTSYFCVSSNLTTAQMVVHRAGALRWATMASASLPVFSPPIADGRHLLVDGALVNNLPVDVMREQMGAARVVAVEVSLEDDETFAVDRVPTPWEMLRSRVPPRRGRAPLRFPGIMETLVRSTLLGSIRREAEMVQSADLCLRPPIERFGLLEFTAMREIARSGYEYATRFLDEGRDASAWTAWIA
ncbi:MAG TPA: cyclic nucleotide-binding and patatin-like phospholipase domain-containing protein [Gemmatimonadaceae bacterium]|nr:cyclic nucleotide-binding and patatin-like phospholipase domain-containing protein [Gemmatimonadaceae bacterium]